MEVKLKLMGILKDRMPESGALELADGATVQDALNTLEIDAKTIQVLTVNGSFERDRGRVLSAGDELSVIPPVGGG